ncbi:MAG: MFS transporter [Armatimonadota bacterium]|nr:MFS transporter [Armatimonadota bacterium]
MTGVTSGFVDRLYRYRTIFGLGLIALLAELAYATLNQSALPPYIDKSPPIGLGLGSGWLGWIMATFLMVEAVFRPPLGALGDRIGRRPLLIAGPLASCAAAILIAHARHPGLLLSLRILDGLGAAAIWPTAFALVGDTVEERNRSTAMSVLNVTYMVGIALGPLLGGAISESTGSEKYAFYAVAALFALTMVVAIIVIPKGRPSHHRGESEETIENPGKFHLSYLLYSLRTIPHMLAMVFFAFCAIGLLIPIAKLYAMDVLKLSETQYGAMLLPVAAVLALFAMPLGRIGDKWGRVESVRLGVALAAAAMWLLALVRATPMLVFGGSLLGAGFLMAMPAWLALVSQLTSSANRGQILGSVMMAQGFGAILGAVLGGYLYAGSVTFGEMDPHMAPLVLSAGLLTLTTLLALVFLDRKALPGRMD